MSQRISQVSILTSAFLGAALAVGCGSDDDSGPKTKSFSEISSQIQEPTGTVDATSAVPVAQEFASSNSAGLGGSRRYAASGTASQACTAGGNMTASATGDGNSGNVAIEYNSCCMVEGCCYSGSSNTVYSDATATSVSFCSDYAVTGTCEGQSISLDFAMCTQADGTPAYSIDVNGQTFTVSGYYSAGNGELTITGANGTWSCTYTNDTGSCTGTGGDFTF